LVAGNQPLEESFSCFAISPFLEEDINDISILINGSLQIMLNTVYLDEHFINEECIAESLAFSFQSFGIFISELITPEANGFITNNNPSFRQ